MKIPEFFPMWDKLTPAQQALLTDHASARVVKKGSILHDGSMECAGVFLVRSGQLRASILSEEGREITIYRLFERDICLFSASCIMRSIQFAITITVEKDAELWSIPPEIYKDIMEVSAPLANFTNEVMATRFSDVMWLIEQVMWRSFDKRLARFLLEEAALEVTNTLKITHEIIGSHLGSPREVVTRMLRYFQTEGMVRLSRGTVELTDVKKLHQLEES